jgi:hypothetical protein
MNLGIEATKTKKRQTVTSSRKGLSKGFPKPVAGTSREEGEEGEEEGGEEQAVDEERELQKDPLKGKIRESLPDEYLQRVMKWKATCYPCYIFEPCYLPPLLPAACYLAIYLLASTHS